MDDAQYLNLMAKLNNIVARLDHISLMVTPPVSVPSSWPANSPPQPPSVLTTTAKPDDPLVVLKGE